MSPPQRRPRRRSGAAASGPSSRGPVSSASCERRPAAEHRAQHEEDQRQHDARRARRSARGGRRWRRGSRRRARSTSAPCSGGRVNCSDLDGHGVAALRVEADGGLHELAQGLDLLRRPRRPGLRCRRRRSAVMPSTITATLMRRTWPGRITRSRRVSETSKFCRSRLWLDCAAAARRRLPSTSPSGRLLGHGDAGGAALRVLGALLGLGADRHPALGVDHPLGDGLAVHVGVDVDLDDGAAGADPRLEQALDVGAQRLGAVARVRRAGGSSRGRRRPPARRRGRNRSPPPPRARCRRPPRRRG